MAGRERPLQAYDRRWSCDPAALPQVVLSPTSTSPKQAELHRMVVPKNSQDTDLKIKLAVRMDKPPNVKHSG